MSPQTKEGEVFGRLTVLDVFLPGDLPDIDDHDFSVWCRVRCSCGKRFRVRVSDLRRGRLKSCGCLRVDVALAKARAWRQRAA